jgi:hypothetical protein
VNDPFSQEFWAENNDLDGPDLERPPICASCGVTMLPANAFGEEFSCQNDECDALDDE